MAPRGTFAAVAASAADAAAQASSKRQRGSPSPTYLPLLDVEKGASPKGRGLKHHAASPASRGCVTGAAGLMRWRWRAQRRLEDLGWVFKQLLSGEVPGLVAALVHGDPEELPKADIGLEHCRTHLNTTLAGCRETLTRPEGPPCHGHVEICMALAGQSDEMGKDELLSAYTALAQEVLTLPIHIRAPVRYNEGLRRTLSPLTWAGHVESTVGMESRHTRFVFDVSSAALTGVQLLHLAVDRDAARLREGKSADYVKRILEAQADVNTPAYYETEAPDVRYPGRRLKTAIFAIHLAVDRESVELVALLLRYQASPETRAVFDMRADYTPLHLAARRGLEGIAKLLIEAGANPAETDLSGRCCHQVCEEGCHLSPPRKCSLIMEEDEEADGETGLVGKSDTGSPAQDRNGIRATFSVLSATATSSSNFPRAGTGFGSISKAATADCTIPPEGHKHFAACAEAMVRLAAARESDAGAAPSSLDLRQCIGEALSGGDVNDLYAEPLPPGRCYKRTKLLLRGCLLHYAVDQAVRLEEEGEEQPEAVVRLVLQASADVHARAHYKTWEVPHTCTALHIAAAGGAPAALALLLDAGASVEAMVTNDTKPHYTPLLDAASEGHYEACELLLARKANPNVPNRLGRTCLHNAVLDGRSKLACLLTENGSDVTLADSIFQETPLLCTIRAKEKYPVADMLYLCRAYHDSRYSLLHDLSSLASCRDKLSVQLLDFVLGCSCNAANPGLKEKKDQLLGQIRRMAVEGKPDENGLTPVDHIAMIIQYAPSAGVRLLADVLMVTPDVQDTTHGTLPVYANLRTGRDSWLPWRRWFGTVEPLLTDYQPDVWRRREDGRDWPCWLFDSTKAQAQPAWHRRFAHMDSKSYEKGNHMVQMKVLLLSNVLDAKVMIALASCWDLDIFAEMPVRAILSFVYIHLIDSVVMMEKLLECSVIGALVAWARAEGVCIHRLCWAWCAAASVHDVVVFVWKVSRFLGYAWSLSTFFSGFENSFGVFISLVHCLLLGYTATGAYSLDTEHGDSMRDLLGAVIIFRFIKLIMLFRYGDWFGTGILAVYNAFHGVFAMFSIMVSCFAAFATAFFVMKGSTTGGELLVTVYRGLMLGDDDSLDRMEHVWGGDFGNGLMVFGTAVFTVYLLNIMIAVLTAEYYKADRQAPLYLWRERAHKSAQALLGPVLPWCRSDVRSGAPPSEQHPGSRSTLSPRPGIARCMGGRANEEFEALCTRRLSDLAVLVLLVLAGVLLWLPLHAMPAGVALGLLLIMLRARLLRCRSCGAQSRGKRFYLWVCHRSDYSRLSFVTEEVEKEHIDELKEKVDRMEDLLRDVHRRLAVGAQPPHSGREVSGKFSRADKTPRSCR